MNQPESQGIGRRNWLKTTSFGTLAAVFGTADSGAKPPAGAQTLKGIILLVSDGMSPGVFTLAEAFSQSSRGKGTRWWKLWNDATASRGLMDTASANSMVPDSAAAASAWGGGRRVHNGVINMTPDGQRVEPISTALRQAGVKLGLVTTTRITHATPAGFATSVPNRGMEDEIARQYLDQAEILLGGGAMHFEKDGLIPQYERAGYTVLRDRAALLGSRDEKLLGLFGGNHLPYSIDHRNDPQAMAKVPTLAEMTTAALDRFLKGDSGFLLVVEGGRVDHAAHLNCIAGVLHDQLAFDDAVAAALDRTAGREDILVVVTSDHGNANPALNGMGDRYEQSDAKFAHVAKLAISHEQFIRRWRGEQGGTIAAFRGFVETHLHFTPTEREVEALHESLRGSETEDWNHQHRNAEGLLGQIAGNHTGIGWTGVTHTSDPTLVSAKGPGADRFAGLVVNTDVNRHLKELLLG